MLGYVLTIGTAKAWLDFSRVIAARLEDREITGLAFAALTALDPNIRHDTAKAALRAAGAPLPAFLGGMDDARWWASVASSAELKSHALAAFEAMSPSDQAAFYRHISEMDIAA